MKNAAATKFFSPHIIWKHLAVKVQFGLGKSLASSDCSLGFPGNY